MPSEWHVALAPERHAGPPPAPHSSCRRLSLPREPHSALRLPWEECGAPPISLAVRCAERYFCSTHDHQNRLLSSCLGCRQEGLRGDDTQAAGRDKP